MKNKINDQVRCKLVTLNIVWKVSIKLFNTFTPIVDPILVLDRLREEV